MADMPHHGTDPGDTGLYHYDGTPLYTRDEPKQGDVARFDYQNPRTARMLLSSLRYWLEEYHLDGFRFCGVTEMLYKNGGEGQAFLSYREFFGDNADPYAALYLQLASLLCRKVRPGCILVAKEESAMPGLCAPVEEGGLGFDLRHSPMPAAYWGETVSRFEESQWSMGRLWQNLSSHLPTDSPLACCECSRQSRPGGKPLVARLEKGEGVALTKPPQQSQCSRTVALHKMIRLATCFAGGEAYLTFMGNEFARPGCLEPTCTQAAGDWPGSLPDSPFYYHRDLLLFEKEMVALAARCQDKASRLYLVNEDAKVLGFWRGRYLLLFNFHPVQSLVVPLPRIAGGAWQARLLTCWQRFGGELDDRLTPDWMDEGVVRVNLPARSAAVYSRPRGNGGIWAAAPLPATQEKPLCDEITA